MTSTPVTSDRPKVPGRDGPGPSPASSATFERADAGRLAPAPADEPQPAAAPGPSDSPQPAGAPAAAGAAPSPGPSDSPQPAPASAADAPGPSDSPGDDPEAEDRSARAFEGPADAATFEPEADAAPADRPPSEKPPRVDGTYLGLTLGPSINFARVNDFPTPDPFFGAGGTLRVGEVIYPWLSVGVEISGNLGYRPAAPRQRLLQGAFLVDFGFYPAPKKLPLSLRAGFGAGGGAIRERGREDRSGFGGAVFTAAARYELFPGAARRRPNRGGGFSLGPEVGWIGFMPAAKGRPMSNTVYVGLFLGFYFGS